MFRVHEVGLSSSVGGARWVSWAGQALNDCTKIYDLHSGVKGKG